MRDALDDWPRRRVVLPDLWRLLDDADPASRGSTNRRHLLATAIEELADAGVLRLPSQRSYDRTELPALPHFVTVPLGTPVQQPRHHTVWHPALSWVPDTRLTPAQRSALERVNRWLHGNRDELVVPVRERSLEIFDDEKAIDRLQTTGLFGAERLTFDLLRVYRAVPRLHVEPVGPGGVLLIVENSDTFDSLCRALARRPGRVGLVGWGAGGAFEASVRSIGRLDRLVTGVRYFGDLDERGLRIPASASLVATADGLPAVCPATGLYTALLRLGRPQPVRSRSGAARPGLPATRADELVRWLEPSQRDLAVQLLRAGRRLAQEAVGLAHLLRSDDWRQDLR
jgi:hypothetical protein